MRRGQIFIFLILAITAIASSAYCGPIYVIKERGGVVRFTSKPPPAGTEAKVFTGRQANFSIYRLGPEQAWVWARRSPLELHRYAETISRAALSQGVDVSLVRAVIHAESAFNPRAVSPKGARGLMQLMPATARQMGVKNSFSPDENIIGGTRYLGSLLRKYQGNIAYALAAYNAGEGAVEKYSGLPPFTETREYVKRVQLLHDRYRAHAVTNG